jgi:hypothetical protein
MPTDVIVNTPAEAPPATPPTKSPWRDGLVLWLNRPYRAATRIALFGLVGTIVGIYFQYNSWRDEKTLTRYQNELATATSTFSEIAQAMSSVMNLQQVLYYTYLNAMGYYNHYNPVDPQRRAYLWQSANDIHKEYFTARTAFRQNVDILSGKAALFLDRPIESDEQRVDLLLKTTFVVSSRGILNAEDFDCATDLPDLQNPITKLKTTRIDWRSAQQHVSTFFYCSEELHNKLLGIRQWAKNGSTATSDPPEARKEIKDLEDALNRQTVRLNAFISVSLANIELLRLRGRPKGFFRHQFFCWWSCPD